MILKYGKSNVDLRSLYCLTLTYFAREELSSLCRNRPKFWWKFGAAAPSLKPNTLKINPESDKVPSPLSAEILQLQPGLPNSVNVFF
jgi:hypothetical protein